MHRCFYCDQEIEEPDVLWWVGRDGTVLYFHPWHAKNFAYNLFSKFNAWKFKKGEKEDNANQQQ